MARNRDAASILLVTKLLDTIIGLARYPFILMWLPRFPQRPVQTVLMYSNEKETRQFWYKSRPK
jgi:hypothetical protein